jgi:uncharacterized iron-regulated protein
MWLRSHYKYCLLTFAFLAQTDAAIACQSGTKMPTMDSFISEKGRDWPKATHKSLIGSYFETAGESLSGYYVCELSPWDELSFELTAALDAGTIVLLGEIHDNAFHHRWRAALIRAINQRKRPRHSFWYVYPPYIPVRPVVLEQLTTDRQQAADRSTEAAAAVSTDDFLSATDWRSTGWSQYDYRPLFDAALAAKMPIYAGDVPKSVIRLAAKQGEAAVPPEERMRLKLDVPLPANQQDAILTELEASHCGMMPKTAIAGMAFAQRLRDATLADVALKAHVTYGSAIVMAGNGHVRGDRGIAWYIRQREPGIKVVTVALVEVEDGKTDPAAYVPRDPEGRPAVDYVVFTPKHVRPDPCDAFKKKP